MKLALCAAASALLLWGTAAQADEGCDPDFGDKALNWAKNEAASQSRRLAAVDYEARAFNWRQNGYEKLQEMIGLQAVEIDRIATEIQTLDNSGLKDIPLAIERERAGGKLLTRLLKVRSELDDGERRFRDLQAVPTLNDFRRDGFGAVGRESLLASMNEIGQTSEASMGGRYGVFVSVEFTGDGVPTGGSIGAPAAGAVSTVSYALIKTSNPYAAAAGVVLLMGGSAYNIICQSNWDTQRDRVREAARLLPAQLINENEQWTLFSKFEAQKTTAFVEHVAKTSDLLAKVEERWAMAFAASASRAAVGDTILTTEKVNAIQDALRSDGALKKLFEQVVMANTAADIGRLNDAVTKSRTAVLKACYGATGLAVEEDQRDGILYATEQLKLFRRTAVFIPLYDLLDKSLARLTTAVAELQAKGPTATKRACNAPERLRSTRQASLPKLTIALEARDRPPVPLIDPPSLALAELAAAIRPVPRGSLETCMLVSKNGQVYTCSRPGGGYWAYGDQFANGTGDPRRDVQQGANDGGFAQDSRRVRSEVDAASINIERRIETTEQRFRTAEKALPDWLDKNGAAIIKGSAEIAAATTNDRVAQANFEQAAGPALDQARQALAAFTVSPLDPSRANSLLGAAGAGDPRLPKVPADAIPGDFPEVIGVTASATVYGATTPTFDRTLARETLKISRDLGGYRAAQRLAQQAVSQARFVSRLPGAGSGVVARQLLLDSAALRFAATGRLSGATIAVVNADGTIARVPLTDFEQLPSNALVRLAQRYQAKFEFYAAGAAQLSDELAAGASYSASRGQVLASAASLAGLSTSTFAAGDVVTGEAIMDMAIGALDVASRFIPGIDWGRDVYEAVSGHDLFTGEELSDLDRASAILGVVTAGVGNNGFQVLKTVEKISNMKIEKAGKIIEFAKTMGRETEKLLSYTTHAKERMAERFLTRDDVKLVLEEGKAFWNTSERTLVVIGDGSVIGERVGVAINVEKNAVTTVMTVEKTGEALLAERITEGRNRGELRYESLEE